MARPKGSPKLGGRQKGTPNKITQSLREMIEQALKNKGGVAYLEQCADTHPPAFLTLIGKAVPMTVDATKNGKSLLEGLVLAAMKQRDDEKLGIEAEPDEQPNPKQLN